MTAALQPVLNLLLLICLATGTYAKQKMYQGVNVGRHVPIDVLPIGSFANVIDVHYRCLSHASCHSIRDWLPLNWRLAAESYSWHVQVHTPACCPPTGTAFSKTPQQAACTESIVSGQQRAPTCRLVGPDCDVKKVYDNGLHTAINKAFKRVNDVSGLIVELKSMTVASPALNTPGMSHALTIGVQCSVCCCAPCPAAQNTGKRLAVELYQVHSRLLPGVERPCCLQREMRRRRMAPLQARP